MNHFIQIYRFHNNHTKSTNNHQYEQPISATKMFTTSAKCVLYTRVVRFSRSTRRLLRADNFRKRFDFRDRIYRKTLAHYGIVSNLMDNANSISVDFSSFQIRRWRPWRDSIRILFFAYINRGCVFVNFERLMFVNFERMMKVLVILFRDIVWSN